MSGAKSGAACRSVPGSVSLHPGYGHFVIASARKGARQSMVRLALGMPVDCFVGGASSRVASEAFGPARHCEHPEGARQSMMRPALRMPVDCFVGEAVSQ